jgi:dephospho-CoA kinase
MSKTILAVVGLAGAGKTEVTKYLLEKTGWPKVYFGDVTFDEMKLRGIEVNEANERKMREELRASFGMGSYAVKSMPKILELYKTSGVIIESLYSWEEYLEVKKQFGENFKVLAVFASFPIRAARMANRQIRPLNEADLQSRDYSQIENLHQAGPIARADWTIVNEGSREELEGKVDEVLKELNE